MGILSLAFAVLGLAGPAHAAAQPSRADLAAISVMEHQLPRLVGSPADTPPKSLADRMAELHVPGVSVAFIEDGRVKWARAYGVMSADGGKPVTPSTLFQAASMSKAAAAAAALKLADQGKVDLDADVNGHLKSWKVPDSPYTTDRKITLRALLSHTAGLTVSGFPGYAVGKPVPTVQQILDGQPPANTPAVRSWETPGKYAYSGGGYTVAQLMIVEAGGKPYPDLLRGLVLKPAGMTQSTMAQPLPEARLAQAASGHDAKGQVIPGARHTYPEYAAAGLWTTPSDYGRFMIGLQNAYAGRPGALMRQASAQAMMTPVDAGYALGVTRGSRGGHPWFEHGGSNEGFRSDSFAFLDGSRQGVVVMTNGDAGSAIASQVIEALAGAYGWGAQDPANVRSARRAPLVPPAAAK